MNKDIYQDSRNDSGALHGACQRGTYPDGSPIVVYYFNGREVMDKQSFDAFTSDPSLTNRGYACMPHNGCR